MRPFGNRKPRETRMECTHIVPWSFLHRNAEQCTYCNLPVRTNISAMTVTQDIPKMIYPGTGTAHIVICSSFLAWPEPILYAHPATIACDPRFSATKKDSKWCSLWHFLTVTFMMVPVLVYGSYIQIPNLVASWWHFFMKLKMTSRHSFTLFRPFLWKKALFRGKMV